MLTKNPFTKAYFTEELKHFSFRPTSAGRVQLTYQSVNGRIKGFLYRDFLHDYPEVPVFTIDGNVWMSITPMEVESHYLPITFAKGRVGVGGLGLGYYVQRILVKEEVKEVVVFEKDPDVIALYRENFGEHDKLNIIEQDVRSIRNEAFDFFYNDIYEAGCDSAAWDDMQLLTRRNYIGHYHFWTMEAFLFALACEEIDTDDFIEGSFMRLYIPFFHMLLEKKDGLVEHWADAEEVIAIFLHRNITAKMFLPKKKHPLLSLFG